MTTTPHTGAHPDEGALLRLLDGQPEPGEEGMAEAHLRGCARCRAQLEEIRALRDGMAALLAPGDFAARGPLDLPASLPEVSGAAAEPGWGRIAESGADASPSQAGADRPGPRVVPLRRLRAARPPVERGWMRAAAVVLVVVGAAAAATPARAWIAEMVSRAWEAVAGEPEPDPAPVTAPAAESAPAEAASSAQVSFAPVGGELTVEVAVRQAGGEVVLVPAPADRVWAEVVGGDAELLVLPGTLRIGNTSTSSADYRIAVPASVRRVRVRVAGTEARTVTTQEVRAAGEARVGVGPP